MLEFWERERVFERIIERGADLELFSFYEGPPTANGKPGIHHVLARTFKDLFPRYKTMRGFHCPRKAGWDTHGLPVEHEVEKALGIFDKKRIEEEVGIGPFVEQCRSSVMRYVADWEDMTRIPGQDGDLLVLADIGDNDARRTNVWLYLVPEPEPGADGRSVTLYHITPGESCILTAGCILNDTPFPAIAETLTDVDGIAVPARSVRRWIHESDAWRNYLFRLLAGRLQNVVELVNAIAFQRLDQRLRALVALAEDHVRRDPRAGLHHDPHHRRLVDGRVLVEDARLQHADLVVGGHDGDDRGLLGDGPLDVPRIQQPGAVHRHHRGAPPALRLLAHRLDVVADQGRDTGVVDEHRRRAVAVDGLLDGMEQALFTAPHDHVLLGKIGGHTDFIESRPRGTRTAVVPGTAGTGNRPMHDMRDIGDRQQCDLRTIEGTTARGSARFGFGAAGLLLLIVGAGRLVEQGPTRKVFATPGHEHTRALLRAAPRLDGRTADLPESPVTALEIRDAHVRYQSRAGQPLTAVRGVDLDARRAVFPVDDADGADQERFGDSYPVVVEFDPLGQRFGVSGVEGELVVALNNTVGGDGRFSHVEIIPESIFTDFLLERTAKQSL